MRQTQVKVGVTLKVVNDRWDASPGTLAHVESTGYLGPSPRTWYFRVRWLIPKATRWGKISTNLFVEDLGDFELYEKPT
jgi:hypothetical protein